MWGVTSPEVSEREVGIQGDFSDNLLFVPHNLGDIGLRKTKILVAAAYKQQSINWYMVRSVTYLCGLFLLICWVSGCVHVCWRESHLDVHQTDLELFFLKELYAA